MFCFLGFLPRRSSSAAQRLLESVADLPFTLVIYASPYRVVDDLEACQACLGDREVVVARELTKFHEEVLRGTIAEMLANTLRSISRAESLPWRYAVWACARERIIHGDTSLRDRTILASRAHSTM